MLPQVGGSARRYAAATSVRLLLLPGPIARRSQRGDVSTLAPLTLSSLGQRHVGTGGPKAGGSRYIIKLKCRTWLYQSR